MDTAEQADAAALMNYNAMSVHVSCENNYDELRMCENTTVLWKGENSISVNGSVSP